MLHIINKTSIFEPQRLSALRIIKPEDALLFLADGVYLLHKINPHIEKLLKHINNEKIFVLEPDVNARGLKNLINNKIKLIDYDDFVALTEQYHPTMNW